MGIVAPSQLPSPRPNHQSNPITKLIRSPNQFDQQTNSTTKPTPNKPPPNETETPPKDFDDASGWVHFKAEGDVEFRALFYLPKRPPPGYYDRSGG